MTLYTVKTLDNRFTLKRKAGFDTMIEWPLCERNYSEQSLYWKYTKFENSVRKTFGADKHYYQYANPSGIWVSCSQRMSDGRWRFRIFFKESKYVTLLLMT